MSKFMASAKVLFDVQKGERSKTLLLFSWLMLFISSYYVLRPIRRGLVLEGLGNESMPFIYFGTAIVTGLVVWCYSKFSHLPRRRLIGTIYGIFITNLLLWWQAFQFESSVLSGFFWVWLDVFSIMGVTLFWMYANDLFSSNSNSASRLFGIVAGGGGLGAVLGSSITAALVGTLGVTNMLLVAAGLVTLTLILFLALEKITGSEAGTSHPSLENQDQNEVLDEKKDQKSKERNPMAFSSAISAIVSNRFLLFLTLVVCLERITPDLIQFLYHEVLNGMATGSSAIAALDANLERWRGIVEVGIELFLVAAVIKRFGTGICLASNGLAIAGCLLSFAIFANPLIVVAIFHADEAMRHSWFKASKEITYTVTSREVLYSVKPIIEMFFYRFARGFAGFLILSIYTIAGLGTPGIVAASIVTGFLWAYCGWQLYLEYQRRDNLSRMLENSGVKSSMELQAAGQ